MGHRHWVAALRELYYLGLAIVLEVAATSSLKAAEGFTRPIPTAIVVLGYAGAFYFLSLSLRTVPVGAAYAIWSGAGTVLIALIGWLAYEQKLSLLAILGIGMIVVGVVIVNITMGSD